MHLHSIKARHNQNSRLHNWSFSQLQFFISYKAELAGVPVIFVDAAYTSQMCSECGYVDKKNRMTRDLFICKSCGYSTDADYNAARNIRARALSNEPDSSSNTSKVPSEMIGTNSSAGVN